MTALEPPAGSTLLFVGPAQSTHARDRNPAVAWPLIALVVGAGAVVFTASGHATGTEPSVVALAGWLAGPLAAVVLAEFRPCHRLGRILATLGAVPVTVLVVEGARTGRRPPPGELLSSPVLLLLASILLIAVAYIYRDSFALALGAAVLAVTGAAMTAVTSGGTTTPGYVVSTLAVALSVTSAVAALTAPPWLHLGVFRTLVLVTAVVAVALVVMLTVIVVAANMEVGGPAGTAPALAVVLGLGLVPLVSWVYRGLSVRLYGTSRQPGRALVNLYDQVPDSADPDALVAAAAAAVAGAVRSPRARVVAVGDGVEDDGPPPAVIPLVAGGEHVGSLVVDPRRPGESFTRRDLTRLAQLAPAVAAITQTARLAQALEEAHRGLVELRATERRRLHHDLHDGMGPLLAGLAMQIASLRRAVERLEDADGAVRRRILDVGDAVALCQAETRRLVDGLAPEVLDRMDLEDALRDLANGWSSSLAATGLRVDLDYTADAGPLANRVRVAAYRIAAEAVTNVVRHADAKWCRIELDTRAGSLRMRVVDDGIGQDGRPSGVGRRSMLERAQAVGGELRIFPHDATVPAGKPGRGTVVEASFPRLDEP